jgi:hypothetical protein
MDRVEIGKDEKGYYWIDPNSGVNDPERYPTQEETLKTAYQLLFGATIKVTENEVDLDFGFEHHRELSDLQLASIGATRERINELFPLEETN